MLQDVHDRVPNTTRVPASIILSLSTELNEDKMIFGSVRVVFLHVDCKVDNYAISLQHCNFFCNIENFLRYQFLFLKFETAPRRMLLEKK